MNSIMKRWLLYTLLGWLQRRCLHPPETVSVDIAEGGLALPIAWCRICGATWIGSRNLHAPRADWWR